MLLATTVFNISSLSLAILFESLSQLNILKIEYIRSKILINKKNFFIHIINFSITNIKKNMLFIDLDLEGVGKIWYN